MSVNPNMHFIPSQNYLPDKVMLTFHPQRWNDNFYDWTKELILQNSKNLAKRILLTLNISALNQTDTTS